MSTHSLNLKNLYRLPWSTYDNPTGWIEPTTHCQLACPGCYRGLDQPNPPRIHEDLKKLKKDIDTLIKIRKIQTIAIAGGEPLLYPHLDQLVAYAHKKGLGVRILTNGALLTKSRLERLRDLGATEIVIHIAQYQRRAKDEKTTYLLRENYCRLFRGVKGVSLQFIVTITRENLKSIPKLMNFYQKNSDIVAHFVFARYQDNFPETDPHPHKYVSQNEIRQKIEKTYGIEPCAYLPKTFDAKSFAWLFYVPVLHNNRVLGYLNGKSFAKIYAKFQLKKKGRFPVEGTAIKLTNAASLLLDKSVRKLLFKYLAQIIRNPKDIFKALAVQVILIIDPPQVTAKGLDLCDGCPDAMLYQGKLVPSCSLERIKLGEDVKLP